MQCPILSKYVSLWTNNVTVWMVEIWAWPSVWDQQVLVMLYGKHTFLDQTMFHFFFFRILVMTINWMTCIVLYVQQECTDIYLQQELIGTKYISIALWFWSQFWSCWHDYSNHMEILHIPRLHCSLAMYSISLWSDCYGGRYKRLFWLNINQNFNWGMGLWTTLNGPVPCTIKKI